MRTKLWHMTVMNLIIIILIKLIALLPLPVVRGLGVVVGKFVWLRKNRSANVTTCNIALCYPDLSIDEQQALARQSVRELGITLTEVIKVWSVKPDYVINRIVAIKNEALYKDALAADSGLILAVPHLGNWEVVGLYAAIQSPMTSMYAPIKSKALNTIVKNSREASGATLVPTNLKGVRYLLKALKKGEQVGILPDQRPEKGAGEYSVFFNQQAYTMTLLNALQSKSGAKVLMAWAEREKAGWVLHFQEPHHDIYSDNQSIALAALNSSVETCVRCCPQQYQWEYKRFSYQPCGTDVYRGLKTR